jgi:acetyltransferase-like isoleucine patch superfamily enzyme
VEIGANSLVIADAMVGGNVKIGERTWIAPCACIRDNITIGKDATVGMGSVVTRSVLDGQTVYGVPAKPREKG